MFREAGEMLKRVSRSHGKNHNVLSIIEAYELILIELK